MLQAGVVAFAPSCRPPELTKRYLNLFTLELTSRRQGWADRSKKRDRPTFPAWTLQAALQACSGAEVWTRVLLGERAYK